MLYVVSLELIISRPKTDFGQKQLCYPTLVCVSRSAFVLTRVRERGGEGRGAASGISKQNEGELCAGCGMTKITIRRVAMTGL